MFAKFKIKFNRTRNQLFFIERLRQYFCFFRYIFLRHRTRYIYDDPSKNFSRETVDYNASINLASFGCGGRMNLLLQPLAAAFRHKISTSKILIVGPRTEDDIFLAKAYGFEDISAIDVFSYSEMITLADAHNVNFEDKKFDAIIVGWVLPYSSNPKQLCENLFKFLADDGIFANGWVQKPNNVKISITEVSRNNLLTIDYVEKLLSIPVWLRIYPKLDEECDCAIFFRKTLGKRE